MDIVGVIVSGNKTNSKSRQKGLILVSSKWESVKALYFYCGKSHGLGGQGNWVTESLGPDSAERVARDTLYLLYTPLYIVQRLQ